MARTEPEPTFLADAPSPRARRAREQLVRRAAAHAPTSEAVALTEAALARIGQMPASDRREMASWRAHRDAADVLRGIGNTNLSHRLQRESQDVAVELADALVKPSEPHLRDAIAALLNNPPLPEVELDAHA